MTRAQQFLFDRYECGGNEVRFHYQIIFDENHREELVERWVFPDALDLDCNRPALNRAFEALHIAVGVSYYKTFVPHEIVTVKPLSDLEADFWNQVYDFGLREFCYVNKIDFELAQFKSQQAANQPVPLQLENSAVLGLGGGKDSIVAGELLRNADVSISGFALNTGTNSGQIAAVSDTMQLDTYHIERYFDRRLLELADQYGGLNGHIPISVMFAISGVITAIATNARYATVGNEAGASIPNLVWNGKPVNHQWSKSLEFERMFQEFVHQTISPNITYFSPIRPLSSVAITKIFCNYPQYFNAFTSCNYVLRMDPTKRPNGRWCQKCDKCLSSFLLFSAWLPEDQVISIFDKNLLDDIELKDSFLALIGMGDHKPLNCVGTPEELLASYVRFKSEGKFADSTLMQLSELDNIPAHTELEAFLTPYENDAIPADLRPVLFKQFTAL